MNLLEELQWRGLYADCTDRAALEQRLAQGPLALYCGFDPTGDSLHVGHLMGQLTLRRFQLAGHHPIALAGGATGMVGDPSGKSAERNLLTREQLAHNIESIKGQLRRLLDFEAATNPARLVDNADWTAPISFLDFLRDVGKHFSVNVMLAKDSVQSRLSGDTGISYTEFSYQLLQAHDFLVLRRDFACELQIGGSDQWGNITAGTDLIRKKVGGVAFGLTFPLITKSDGTKFGKTESGAVWLDPQRTSPYKFYQFFVNTEDVMLESYLKKFTFLGRPEIEALLSQHTANPGARVAHRALAREVTTIVHGAKALVGAEKASEILFGGSLDGVTEEVFQNIVGEVPTKKIERSQLGAWSKQGDVVRVENIGGFIADLIVHAELAPSKGQARKDLEAGGFYLNNNRVGQSRIVTSDDLLFGKYLLLRKGKRTYAVLKLA